MAIGSSCTKLLFLLAHPGLIMPSEAINLRSRELAGKPSLVQKGEDPIPDPKCKKGVMSPDMKVRRPSLQAIGTSGCPAC